MLKFCRKRLLVFLSLTINYLLISIAQSATANLDVPLGSLSYNSSFDLYVWPKKNPIVGVNSYPNAPTITSGGIIEVLDSTDGPSYALQAIIGRKYILAVSLEIYPDDNATISCSDGGVVHSYDENASTVFYLNSGVSNFAKLNCWLGWGYGGLIRITKLTLISKSGVLPKVNSKNSCKVSSHSEVNIDSLSLEEDIPLVGTPFNLNYSSSRLQDSSSPFVPKILGLGGWTPSLVHFYDSINGILYSGNNELRNVKAVQTASGFYVTDELGSEIYYFDLNGKHLSTKDSLTGIKKFTFEYDSIGRISTIKDQFNNTTSFTYSANAISISSPYGQITSLSLDSYGLLASVTNPNNETYKMTNSSSGQLLTFQKPGGQVSTVSYDSDGFVTKDIGAGGDFVNLVRNFDNQSGVQTVAMSTALNRTTVYSTSATATSSSHTVTNSDGSILSFNDQDQGESNTTDVYGGVFKSIQGQDPRFGWLAPFEQSSSFTQPDSNISALSSTTKTADLSDINNPFSFTKLTTKTVLQNDPTQSYISTYQASNKQTITTSPLGRLTYSTLNANAQLASSQIGSLTPVNFSYDDRGRLISMGQGDRKSTLSYDKFSNLYSQKDSLGRITKYEYDKANRMTAEIFPDGRKIMMTYDQNGNLASITPPGKKSHSFIYNLFESVQNYLPPSLRAGVSEATSYSYNLDKQLTKISLPDGREINYNYGSSSGLLDSISTSNGDYLINYQANSNLINSISSPDNIVMSYQYVGSTPTQVKTTGTVSSTIDYSFDSTGSVSEISVAGDKGIKINYDLDKMPITIGAENLSFNSNSLLTSIVHENISQTLNYNNYGEMLSDSYYYKGQKKNHKKEKDEKKYQLNLTRDQLGRIISKTESIAKDEDSFNYSYDSTGQLIEVLKNGRSICKYVYDSNGNRIKQIVQGKEVEAFYDEQDRLIRYGKNQYKYDDNGNLLEKISSEGKNFKFNYDVFGNLKKVQIAKKDEIEYIVDGNNRRIGKKLNGKLIQAFVYQSQTQIAAELDNKGNVVKRFVYGSKANIPDYLIDNKGRTYKIISNQIGTPKLIVDVATGKIVQKYEFDEFGNLSDSDDYKNENKIEIPFGFGGGLYDSDTRLVRFGARDYDVETGRWMSKDPIGFNAGDNNLYRYSQNDPINRIDPTGLDSYITYNFGHFYLIVDSPKRNGEYFVFSYGPLNNTIVAYLVALYGIHQSGFASYGTMSASVSRSIYGVEVPHSRVSQGPSQDAATIDRAKKFSTVTNVGGNYYNLYNLDSNGYNCFSAARKVQKP